MRSQRDETPEEQADRRWEELLQEFRVIQTGTQLIAGFLLTLPLQQRFSSLDTAQRGLYLVLVVLAVLTTAFIMTPVAIHRRLSGLHVKRRLVAAADVLLVAALTSMGALVTGISVFIFDLVVNRVAAGVVGAVFAMLLVVLLLVLPSRLVPGD